MDLQYVPTKECYKNSLTRFPTDIDLGVARSKIHTIVPCPPMTQCQSSRHALFVRRRESLGQDAAHSVAHCSPIAVSSLPVQNSPVGLGGPDHAYRVTGSY